MEEPRKLYRSRNQRMVGGVCGGLADYFNIDVTVVRVLFLILSVFGGTGLVIYLVMWIIVPDVSQAEAARRRWPHLTRLAWSDLTISAQRR
jgi:phage shock protein C